ncbi:MAG TPA: hypothetical protein VMI56_06215 [Reyranella sp.]|nr:hypothetical protein [Reyranella sp.]
MRGLGLIVVLLWAPPASAADIVDHFKTYLAGYKGSFEFLQDGADKALAPNSARQVVVDRGNGYVQISDSSGTDRVLTAADYRKADGGEVLVVGSSDCADACNFTIEFFAVAAGGLKPLAREDMVPAVAPSRFIKAGGKGPSNAPTINYVPARVGTGLTLKPWYGYEVEEQMPKAVRESLQDVVLNWDRAQGHFR